VCHRETPDCHSATYKTLAGAWSGQAELRGEGKDGTHVDGLVRYVCESSSIPSKHCCCLTMQRNVTSTPTPFNVENCLQLEY
jgi:hypothetical protein